MSKLKRWSVAILMLVTLQGGMSKHASAEEPPDDVRTKASRFFDEGKTHFKLGEFKAALDSFKEAYRLVQRPAILYNIAQCHRLLGEKESAIRAYRSYLNDAPNVPNRADVEAIIGKLQEQVAAEQRSKEAPPQGVLNEGQSSPRLTPPSQEARPEPSDSKTRPSTSPSTSQAEKPKATGLSTRQKIGIGLIGAGAGVAVVGAGLVGYSSSLYSDALNAHQLSEEENLRSRSDTMSTAGWPILGVGCAAAVAGAITLAVGSRSVSVRARSAFNMVKR